MKKKLIELLNLPADASEDQITAAIAELKAKAESAGTPGNVVALDADEKAIRAKIAASGGALNRESAAMALAHQAEADKAKKQKK